MRVIIKTITKNVPFVMFQHFLIGIGCWFSKGSGSIRTLTDGNVDDNDDEDVEDEDDDEDEDEDEEDDGNDDDDNDND
jgi:hypothetical protein